MKWIVICAAVASLTFLGWRYQESRDMRAAYSAALDMCSNDPVAASEKIKRADRYYGKEARPKDLDMSLLVCSLQGASVLYKEAVRAARQP